MIFKSAEPLASQGLEARFVAESRGGRIAFSAVLAHEQPSYPGLIGLLVTNFIDRHIGGKISDLRSQRRMTSRELGEAANIRLSDLHLAEAGMAPLSAIALRDLCLALDVDPSVLFEQLTFAAPLVTEAEGLLAAIVDAHQTDEPSPRCN